MDRITLHIPVQFWAKATGGGSSFVPGRRGAVRLGLGATAFAGLLGLLSFSGLASFPLYLLWATLLLSIVTAPVVRFARRYGQYRTAVDNMWQGLALFDAGGRLLLFNAQFCTMLRLRPADVQRGATQRDIVALSVAAGNHGGSSAERVWDADADFIAARRAALTYIELPDNRTIAQSHQPTADGGWIRTYADVTGRRQVEARIVHMARHDALTDLPNRAVFHERLDHALQMTSTHGSLAVLFIDLDQFKAVNDTLGHTVGDLLLVQVAGRLQHAIKGSDIVARLGGDEFAVIQVGVQTRLQAERLARHLIDVISNPYDLDGSWISIGTSIGITLAPEDGTATDKLLKNADMALYQAKSLGRGVHCFFAAEMDAQINRRRTLQADLRDALRSGQFELHYQPLVTLRCFRVERFEALLRWSHPLYGRVDPSEFVPIAEEIGVISALGAWVLKEACQTAAEWPDQIGVAVNVSAAQLRSGHLGEAVAAALDHSGLDRDRLELEVTESVMLQENDATRASLQSLIELGVRLTMDDFGTGYSSLISLSRFPFQTIKIDRSLISDIPTSPGSLAILRAVVQLGRSLGMKVTAEGIETREQLDGLMAEGCNVGQGFLFGRPMPQEATAGFLHRWEPDAFRKAPHIVRGSHDSSPMSWQAREVASRVDG